MNHRPQVPGVETVTGPIQAQIDKVTEVVTEVVGSLTGVRIPAPTGLAKYIVQLSDPPLASYRGGTAGLAPTNPAALGETRLDPKSDASEAYLAYLAQQHLALQLSLTKALGLCAPVTGAPFCNSKLIGVYDFTGTTPEDDNEHGSHTASTAVGNVINAAVLHAPTIDITRKISGVAPQANLITYKACTAAGCLNVSTTQAIDQATADGVDVINFSIGGGSDDAWSDSNAQAFLSARDAGTFASVATGNSGPAPSTMGSPANAPWVTAVAATTHNRKFVNKLAGMSGGPAEMTGAGMTAGYGPAKIVYAGDYGAPPR